MVLRQPGNYYLTKSPVVKNQHPVVAPAIRRPFANPTSSFDRPSYNEKICEDIFFMASFLVPRSHETFAKEIAGFEGGNYRRVSLAEFGHATMSWGVDI